MKAIILIAPLVALISACNIHQHHPVPVPEYSKDSVLRSPKGKVMEPAVIEAYPVARYQDPCNKDLMHEKHFVYRRQAPQWKLNSSPSERVYLGEAAGVRSGKVIARTSEAAVSSSRDIAEMKDEIHALTQNQKQLGSSQLAIMEAIQRGAKPQQNRVPSTPKAENPVPPSNYNPSNE